MNVRYLIIAIAVIAVASSVIAGIAIYESNRSGESKMDIVGPDKGPDEATYDLNDIDYAQFQTVREIVSRLDKYGGQIASTAGTQQVHVDYVVTVYGDMIVMYDERNLCYYMVDIHTIYQINVNK